MAIRKTGVYVLLAALTLAACESERNPAEPSPPPLPGGAVYFTAVGASDAIGVGGSVVCIPLTVCNEGTGYVQIVHRRLKDSGKSVTHLNLGLPGAVLSPEIQAIGNSMGRDIFANFLERELPFVPRDSTLVTVFAGGNDVNTIGEALERGLAGADRVGYVNTQIQNFGRDIRALVSGIQDRAEDVRVVVINLPNMAAMPYVSGLSLDRKRWLQMIAVGFSNQINSTTSLGAKVVDLMCDDTFYSANIFSSDGFHPNDSGYAYLADRVYAAATGTIPAPRATCPRMTMF
jgi:lysophospholipase L1-like esterase